MMHDEKHKQIVRQVVEAVNGNQYGDAIGRLISPQVIYRHNDKAGGANEWVTNIRDSRIAFPDSRLTIVSQTLEGDRLITCYQFTGTHTGPRGEIPPTGKRVEITGVVTTRLENDMIAELDEQVDEVVLAQQLGLGDEPPGL
ncbi:MAG TPA: ester cyclase [Thermoflexus sp.]|nr:ester cyclase [Thermoflexus sp.]